MNTLVIEKAGKPMTTSLKIAEVFEKRHANILRDITAIKRTLASVENNELTFELVKYQDNKGEDRPMYLMDRDAFALLVFGFNGPKAIQFKIDFIQAFNTMEFELMKAKKKLIAAKDLPEILRMAADVLETVPKVEAPSGAIPEKQKTKMTLTKIPRNMKTASIRHTLGNMGLRPIKTTDFLADTGYLKVVSRNEGDILRERKLPTKKGEDFFSSRGNGLYITREGTQMLLDKKEAGEIPEDCLKVIA